MVLLFQSLAAPVSVAAGAATGAAGERKSVSIEGVFVATYQVQVSLDNSSTPAAASWQNVGAALSAAGILEISLPCAWVRLNCTAYTSGAPVARLCVISSL